MITLRKLASLPEGTRRRKTLALVREAERAAAEGRGADRVYMRGLLHQAAADGFWPAAVRDAASALRERLSDADGADPADLRRDYNLLGHAMAGAMGMDWADWNLRSPADRGDDAPPPRPLNVYIDGIRSPFNIGSVMRTALAFGSRRLWVSPESAAPDHPRCRRSAMGADESLDWTICSLDELDAADTGPVFALELGGDPIGEFNFPDAGTVVLGSEELGVSPPALERAKAEAGVVSIPLPGGKASLNVGVAFGILMERWVSSLEG